jgi:hypothetical protein
LVAIGLVVLVSFNSTPVVGAWGRVGHRVISRFAEQRLTAQAKAGLRALLADGESLADASTWADEHRRKLPKTAPWHYVDVPLDQAKYDPKWSADDQIEASVTTSRKGAEPNPILESEPPIERRPVDVTTRWTTPADILIAAPSPTIVAMNGGVPWIPA